MVKVETIINWLCPYCGVKYNTEDEAWDCARDCADIDPPEQDIEEFYFCDICEKKYDEESDAEDCEEEHIEVNDKQYQEHLRKEEMAKLYIAGTHPNQSALMGVRAIWQEKKKVG